MKRSVLLFLLTMAVVSFGCGNPEPLQTERLPEGPSMLGNWTCSAGPSGDDLQRVAECWPASAPAKATWEAYGGESWRLNCPAWPIDETLEGVNFERSRLCWPVDASAFPAVAVCSARWPWMPNDGSGIWVTDRSIGRCRAYPGGEVPDVCGDGHFNPRSEVCDGVMGCNAGYMCVSDCTGCMRMP